MTNNDILRRLRYTFNFNDKKMITLFDQGSLTVSREQVSNWLKKEDDPQYINCTDTQLACFLNGLIVEKRGAKEGEKPKPEKRLTNNIILTKLKIAMALKAEDMIAMFATTGLNISKPELSAFFRKPDHKHFRQCKDQFLRNFIQSMDEKYHVKRPEKFKPKQVTSDSADDKVMPNKQYKAAKPQASKIYHNPNAKTQAKGSSEEKPKRKVLKLKPEDIWGKDT